MALPASKTEITADLDKAFWAVFGPPGVGKSSFCASFPDPLFLTTEQAHRHLKIFNRVIRDWADFKHAILELQSKDGARFQSIVVDTVDILHSMCTEWVCKEEGLEHPSDGDFGKGWSAVSTAFQREIVKLTLLGKGIFFVSHAKQIEVTARNLKYSKTVPTMPGGCHKVVLPLVDIEMYMGFSSIDVSQRAAVFEPRESLEAKDRFGRFPKEVILPKTGMYGAIKAAWEGKAAPAQSKPAAASPAAGAVRRVAVRK